MDSAGKRKNRELNPEENPNKKTRRKSCLTKKSTNVQRDPTEPIFKAKKSRVSFAPKECHVKEFSSYNSSGNSSSSFDPSMLTRSFENENKENTESPLINQGPKQPVPDSPMNNTLDLLDESSMVAPITPTGQTRSLFNLTTTQNISKAPTPPTDKEQISNLTPVTVEKITPKKPKRRSLLETVQQRSLFRRQESQEDLNSTHMNSFKADMFKLFQMSSPVTSPAKIERLETNSESEPNTDDTIAILGNVGTEEDSNDEHKTLQFEKTMAMEQTMNFDMTMNQTVNKTVALDQTVDIEKTMVFDENEKMDFQKTLNITKPQEKTMAVQRTRLQHETMHCSDFTSPIHLASNVKKQGTGTLPLPKAEEEMSEETLKFINLEKSVAEEVNREKSQSQAQPIHPLTPLQKLRRSLSASPAISREEVSDNIPNFTPPSRKIDMIKFQKELADPPGTPDICKNKFEPRHKLMRARDSIGVAKFKIDQKIRRESGDDLSRTSLENAAEESFSGNTQNLTGKMRSKAQLTREVTSKQTRELTGKSTRQNTGRLTRDVTITADKSNSNLSRLTEPSFRLPTQNRSEMITPDLEISQRPTGSLTPAASKPISTLDMSGPNFPRNKKTFESSDSEMFPELEGSVLGESFLSMDQTEAIEKSILPAFKTREIIDDSLQNSLDAKDFGCKGLTEMIEIPKNDHKLEPEVDQPKETFHNPTIESINEIEEAVRNMGEPNFNDLGTPLEEIFEDGPEKFMYFNLSKPNELYNEYATERLKKDLKRMSLTDDELELLEKAKEKLSADFIFSEFSERSRIQSELAYHKIRLQIVKKQAELYESLEMVVHDVSCEIKNLEEKKQKLTENEKLTSEIDAKKEKAKSDVEKLKKDKSDLETLQNSEKALDDQIEELRLKIDQEKSAQEDDEEVDPIETLCAEFDAVHVRDKLYFLDGLVFYHLDEQKWVLNPNLVMEWHPHFRCLKVNRLFHQIVPKILHNIVVKANLSSDFKKSYENLLEAHQTAKLLSEQLYSYFDCPIVCDIDSEVEENHIKIASCAFTEDFDSVEVILDFDVSTEDLKWSVHQYQDYECDAEKLAGYSSKLEELTTKISRKSKDWFSDCFKATFPLPQ